MKKGLTIIGLLLVALGWFLYVKPEPPFGALVNLKWDYSYSVHDMAEGTYMVTTGLDGTPVYTVYKNGKMTWEKIEPVGLTLVTNQGTPQIAFNVFKGEFGGEVKESTPLETYRALKDGGQPTKTVISWKAILGQRVSAAISSHATSTFKSTAGATELTYAFDVGTDADRLLVVYGAPTAAPLDIPDGGVYAGVDMTLSSLVTAQACGNNIYYSDAPTSGSNNIVIRSIDSGSQPLMSFAQSYNGADTKGANVGASSATGEPSLSLTTTKANSFVFTAMCQTPSTGGNTPTQGETQIDTSGEVSSVRSAASYEQIISIGANTFGWTDNGNGWDFNSIEIKEAGAGAAGGKPRRLIIQ
jgi:hypothetical protein